MIRILILLLFPIFLSAQITNAYGVIEIGGFPTSSATGPKFAYNPADSSFYRWRSGSTWVKVIEPSITSAGWGIIKTGLTYLVDSSKVASRYYVSTSPTTIAANYVPASDGTNLVARNLFNSTSYAGVIGVPWAFPEWTTAGRPTGANNRWGFNTTNNWLEGYSVSGWVAPAQATNADGRFLAGTIPYADANGRLKYGSYSELYFSSTEFVAFRAPYFSSNVAGVSGGLRIYNTNTTSGAGYGSVALYPSTGGHYAQFFCTNTLYPGYGVVTPSSFGHYTDGSGGMGIQLDNASSSLRVGIGTTGTIEKMRLNTTGLGIGRAATVSKLEVAGDGEFYGKGNGIAYIGGYPTTVAGGAPDLRVEKTGFIYNTNSRFAILSGSGASVGTDIIMQATATRKLTMLAFNDTIPGISISLSKATFIRERLIIAPDSTFKFDPTTDMLQLSQYGGGAKTTSSLSKTFRGLTGFATDGTVLNVTSNEVPNFYNNNDSIGTGRIATVLDSVRFNNGSTEILKLKSNGQVTLGEYTSSGDFVPSIVGEAPTDLFLTTSASTGKVMQRKMRQTTSVTDGDLTITASNLQDAQDYHVWATCSISASDSVVVSLPTPSSTYQGQMVYVYGDGRNATPDRDVYVKCTGKLWYGNSAPTAESYFQVTSLSGGINSRTASFICAYNGSTYYWQLMKSHD